MWKEIPALYDLARQITHDLGGTWTDPRTGMSYPPLARHCCELCGQDCGGCDQPVYRCAWLLAHHHE